MSKTPIEVLDIIIADCEQDVKDFEHAPFTGKTVGQLHGIIQAKIQALAKIIKEHMEVLTAYENPTKSKEIG